MSIKKGFNPNAGDRTYRIILKRSLTPNNNNQTDYSDSGHDYSDDAPDYSNYQDYSPDQEDNSDSNDGVDQSDNIDDDDSSEDNNESKENRNKSKKIIKTVVGINCVMLNTTTVDLIQIEELAHLR